ncbi:MAG: NTP transferase domain-containing protein, partial [Elusimicrobiota bacterium]
MRGLGWAGIIAAGEGSRLGKDYPGLPKPLVPVAGRPLVHWVASSLRAAGVRHLWVLLNSRGDAVRSAIRRSTEGMRVRFLRRDTASSWESFRLVSRALAGEAPRFLVSTVDAIVPPADARRFAAESGARWGAAGGGS